MFGNEALSTPEPRSKAKQHKSFRKTLKGYFFAAWFLFIIVLMLGINNYIVYRTYRDVEKKSNEAYLKIKSLTIDNKNLNEEKENLAKENAQLKEEFQTTIGEGDQAIKEAEEIKKQRDELLKKNKELTEDNIALQNSLKKAAAVGIKPQNFSEFDGVTSRGGLERGKYIGSFLGTAYTPSKEECGSSKGITNSGHPVIPGVSVAIDNKYWPFGTVFYIKGLGYAVAMDTGSAIKGKYRFDFVVFDKKFARKLGSGYWDVYLVRLGQGRVGDISF